MENTMAIKVFECENPECEWEDKLSSRSQRSKDLICPKCNSKIKINRIKTMKLATGNDIVPGGYDQAKLNEFRQSEEGVKQEADFLSGKAKSAF